MVGCPYDVVGAAGGWLPPRASLVGVVLGPVQGGLAGSRLVLAQWRLDVGGLTAEAGLGAVKVENLTNDILHILYLFRIMSSYSLPYF